MKPDPNETVRVVATAAARTVLPEPRSRRAAASATARSVMPGRIRTTPRAVSVAVRTSFFVGAALIALLAIGPVTGAYRTLTVLSGSMRPYMQPGDVVVVTPIAARDLKPGDIVTYHLPTDGRPLVTHRVTAVLEPGSHPVIQTKGDANNTPDAQARLDESRVWRTRAVVPKVGYVLVALRHPAMRLIGSVLAPLLLLVVWLLHIWGKPRDDTDDAGQITRHAAHAEATEPAPPLPSTFVGVA
jgi:signal peptidase I